MSGRGAISSSSNDGLRMIGGGGRAGRGRRGGRGGAARGRGGRGGSSTNHKRSFAPASSESCYSSPGKRSHHNGMENSEKHDVAMSDAIPAGGFGQQEQPPQESLKSSSHADDTSQEQKLAHMTNQRFADLNISLASRRALSEIFQYEYMTSVQAETLPLILRKDNQDMLAKAKTGTGKTLAFMIPTIEKIIHKSSNSNNNKKKNPNSDTTTTASIHCLVISPTRELAQQIAAETSKLLTFHDPKHRKVVICVGGTNKNADLRAFAQSNTPIAALVATPGRLLDHLQTTTGFAAQISSSLSTLILDECDQLLDMGFRPDIERILSFLKQQRQTNNSSLQQLQPPPPPRQTLLFSATIPPSVNEIASLALRPNYHFVDTVGEDAEQTHMHVQQQLMVTTQEGLIPSLFAILERETTSTTTICASNNNNNNCSGYKIIVFFTTARLTGYMAELFNSVSGETGYHVLEIHSRKSQSVRERASEQFRKSKNAILFSSDVSARGMDYPDVSYVLQVGLTDRAQYIHRLGRTARAGKEGKGGLLLANYEEYHMTKRELADMPLERLTIPSLTRAHDIGSRAVSNVSRNKPLRNSAEQAYRAWLGYYNGQLKKVKWDKKQLVAQANAFGKDAGLNEQPSLPKKTVGKMGLKGVPGLKIEG